MNKENLLLTAGISLIKTLIILFLTIYLTLKNMICRFENISHLYDMKISIFGKILKKRIIKSHFKLGVG